MDHSGDGDFFYFLFCEMIECRDDSSCADHGYNSADSDSYRAAGSDKADRKGNDDGGEIKKIFSETHVLSAALTENSCQAVGRVWDDVDVYGDGGANSGQDDGKDKNEKPHSHLIRCRENPVENGDKGARQVTCGNLQKLERREFSLFSFCTTSLS